MPSVFIRPLEGSLLVDVLIERGMGGDVALDPGQDLPESAGLESEYPIYIALPPTQLGSFLDNLPQAYKARTDDFVFFAGGLEYGNIEDVLKERGETAALSVLVLLRTIQANRRKTPLFPPPSNIVLYLSGYCRDTMTQVLITGMRIGRNNQVEDMKTLLGSDAVGEDKIAGECSACGKWAGSIAARLDRSNVFCRTEFYREWRRKMWERSLYDALFSLIGVIRQEPTTMSDVANYYAEEVSDIVWEMSQLLRGWRAITLTYGFEERLLGVGESAGAGQPCAIVDEMYPFIWGIPTFLESKTFVEYLQYAQHDKGLLQAINLPQRTDADYTSHMRQGNLRADGVV